MNYGLKYWCQVLFLVTTRQETGPGTFFFPLELSEVISAGVEIGLRREGVCTIEIGESLSGVIYKDVDGTIRLEKELL